MTTNVVNQVAYLRTSRNFPEEIKQLTVEVNKSYVDIANAVNSRTISIFPTSRPAITGESWFVTSNQKQQTLRQVYPFGTIAPAGTVQIPHGITSFNQFSRIFGTCITNFPDYRPIPYASVAPNANIDVRVDATNIIIVNGTAGPTITSGIIVLEWLSQS